MITLNLDWREVLWWMQGGMAGSHLRWSVYEDMVNNVWPQASEQERRNMFLIMRRDFGTYWRPDGWSGYDFALNEGDWREDINDKTPWMYFRQVLARFNPDNQYAVTMQVKDSDALDRALCLTSAASIISKPSQTVRYKHPNWKKKFVVRAYKWQDEYRIDWSRRCAEDVITKIEKIDIPDEGTM